MKEKLVGRFGVYGYILYMLIMTILSLFPLFYIDIPFLLYVIFAIIMFLFGPSSIIFWVWGLIETITGPQNLWAILYYAFFTIGFLPIIFAIVLTLVKKKA